MHEADDQDELTQPTHEHSTRHRTAIPSTMLVTELDNGALIIQGRPEGPRVYLSRVDAVPLRRELAAALEGTAELLRSDQGEVL
ncbi:MAG: hypothetical protein ACRDS0_16090 [Pseudonocardiaceae bacterium]